MRNYPLPHSPNTVIVSVVSVVSVTGQKHPAKIKKQPSVSDETVGCFFIDRGKYHIPVGVGLCSTRMHSAAFDTHR